MHFTLARIVAKVVPNLGNGDLFFDLFADSRSRDMSGQIHRVVE